MTRARVTKVGIAAVVAIAAVAFLVGPKPDRPATASPAAIAASGATTVDVLDPVHDRPFQVSTWSAAGEDRNTLVVISHGFSGGRTSQDHLAADLAADGYTVAAPTHPDMAGLTSGNDELDPLVLRPRHLSLTIDHLTAEAAHPFEEVIIVGHSLGAYSALRVAGANPSGEGVAGHCEANPSDNVLCTSAARERMDRLVATGGDVADSRVDAIVLLAPGYGPLFSADDLRDVSAEITIVAASSDVELPGDQVNALVQAAPASTVSTTVAGGHYVFLRTCTETEQSVVAQLCTDDAVDRERARETVSSAVGRNQEK